MTSVPHEPALQRRERPEWAELLRIPEMWGSLAISMMWLAVLCAAVWGPDFVSTNGAGTQSTTIPSGILVAIFAFFGSASVAKRSFGRDTK